MTETEQTEQGGGWMDELAKSFAPLVAQAAFAQPILVRKVAVCVPTTPELLAEVDEMREAQNLMVRLLNGTATAEERAEHEARKAARQAERDAARVAAVAEWEQLRERYADSPAVLAVLDIHQPDEAWDRVICRECCESDIDDTVGVAWPCSTYEAIRDAVS